MPPKAKLKARRLIRSQSYRMVASADSIILPSQITVDFVPKLIHFFKAQKTLSMQQASQLLEQGRALLETLPNVLELKVNDGQRLTVLGDTHGQFFDLLHVFEVNGPPSADNPYLVNGDFVDRGSFGSEIVFTLLAYKLACPASVHLLRGNHECEICTLNYGFKNEVHHKYNATVYANFMHTFNALPLAAVINRKVFVVHGGLWKRKGILIDEINTINRFCQPGDEGGEALMAQMLWSDPIELNGLHPSLRPYGASFGPDYTHAFLAANGLEFIVRSHEMQDDGYSLTHGNQLATLFSAPGYCGDINKGAFLILSGRTCLRHFIKFASSPHPAAPDYFDLAMFL
ncbi:putative Serine/threonine-protein phosphatase [Blattamonas nauphoetae]|uniref:Serine/threonine-protein phosphatase n=1 Tax=Blattamonas nauphoetae TaxID=2049346 RepID=A0ABQ9YKT5_9EUKA|nr:putative Serine/threonine-protein phosphatase [Blattamonas nauphoetae]